APASRGLRVDAAVSGIFNDRRDGQLEAQVGKDFDIPGLFADIVDQHGLPQLSSASSHSFAHLNASAFSNFTRVANLETHAQFLGAFVEKKNSEDLVVDDS